jgi:hypothetical protein
LKLLAIPAGFEPATHGVEIRYSSVSFWSSSLKPNSPLWNAYQVVRRCAHLVITGELRHAEYIANWITLLKEDQRAIFTAASKAQQAADFLRAHSEVVERYE